VYDLGAVVPLAVSITDATGAPTDATGVVCAVTLPDGTTASPAPTVDNPSTGSYTANFTTTQAGRHVVSWSSTSPQTAYVDVFDVRSVSVTPPIVSLADVKTYLRITSSTDDDELRDFIGTATAVIESYVGAVSRRTVVEKYNGDWNKPYLPLRTHPVISVGSVVEGGNTLVAETDYTLTDTGILVRVAGPSPNLYPRGWVFGIDNVIVTYDAGRPIIGANLIEAAKELIRWNWRPQRGGDGPAFSGGNQDESNPTGGQIVLGFYVPNSVLERLGSDVDVTRGIA
jgi:hypothetical protein